MTPFEESGGLLSKLPWESSPEGVSAQGEGAYREQAELDNVVFVDFKKGASSRPAYFRSSKRKYLIQFLYRAPDVMTDLQHVYHHASPRRNEQERAMARLEDAAKAADRRAFLEALRELDWEDRLPATFVRVVRLAFEAGAYEAARKVAADGVRRYPEDSEIQEYARVLSPPKASFRDAPPDPSIGADDEWLKAHRTEYRGQWVALRGGKLLGVAGSLRELVELVGDTKGALLTMA